MISIIGNSEMIERREVCCSTMRASDFRENRIVGSRSVEFLGDREFVRV